MAELTALGESLPSLGHSVNVKEELCTCVMYLNCFPVAGNRKPFPIPYSGTIM